MKSSIIFTLVSALAATVKGFPIVDNTNMAVAKSAQADAAGANIVHGLVHRRFNNIQSPGSKMPVSAISMNSSVSGALALPETKTNVTFGGAYTTHMSEAVPTTFDTSVTGTKGNMSDMPVQTSSAQVSSTSTTMNILDYADQVQYWFTHCLPHPVERRPKECATMKPSIMTESEPVLELTTIMSMITPASTEVASVTSELWMESATVRSLMNPTPTPTDEGVIVVTVTSTVNVMQTEDPEIEYTFAKVDSASIKALRG
ncbi:hypothetical protein LX32DRAFT_647615 [Colletotrichum zoysiae]|uniref:Uncharacterized protein n=1 Tax=Colletotrichum zoysiae TaxID=1216348 RepID=A0AAD9HWP1_9PEZI|nr:hypothetical protein LX32DRAFT_647615 [Colletotrichum zoysiae]